MPGAGPQTAVLPGFVIHLARAEGWCAQMGQASCPQGVIDTVARQKSSGSDEAAVCAPVHLHDPRYPFALGLDERAAKTTR